MTKRTQLTIDDSATIRVLIDEKIDRTISEGRAKDGGAGLASDLAPLFSLREKFTVDVEPKPEKLARKDRCAERLGTKRRCTLALNHDGNHFTSEGREFGPDIVQPKAGWVPSAEAVQS